MISFRKCISNPNKKAVEILATDHLAASFYSNMFVLIAFSCMPDFVGNPCSGLGLSPLEG